jgi:hypothetical protein
MGKKYSRFSYDIIAQTGGIVIIWDKIIINGGKKMVGLVMIL